jgi:hypothetical protein
LDQSNEMLGRTRPLKLDIFGDLLVLRDDNGWQITDSGRQFLASLEAPVMSQHEQAVPEADASTAPLLPAPPPLRLVVHDSRRPGGRGTRPTRRSA